MSDITQKLEEDRFEQQLESLEQNTNSLSILYQEIHNDSKLSNNIAYQQLKTEIEESKEQINKFPFVKTASELSTELGQLKEIIVVENQKAVDLIADFEMYLKKDQIELKISDLKSNLIEALEEASKKTEKRIEDMNKLSELDRNKLYRSKIKNMYLKKLNNDNMQGFANYINSNSKAHQEEMIQRDKAHKEEMIKIDKSHQEEKIQRDKAHQEEMIQRDKAHQEEMEQKMKEGIEKLTSIHSDQMNKKIKDAKKEQNKKTKDLMNSHTQQMNNLINSHNEEMENVKNSYNEEMKNLINSHNEEMKNFINSHNEEMKNVVQPLRNEIDTIKLKSHLREISTKVRSEVFHELSAALGEQITSFSDVKSISKAQKLSMPKIDDWINTYLWNEYKIKPKVWDKLKWARKDINFFIHQSLYIEDQELEALKNCPNEEVSWLIGLYESLSFFINSQELKTEIRNRRENCSCCGERLSPVHICQECDVCFELGHSHPCPRFHRHQERIKLSESKQHFIGIIISNFILL